jgi:myo-inositol 2-dehydrogenase / D-chiro-inositol 1-dehydrogenase
MDTRKDVTDALSRRDFLKASAVSAASAALLASGNYAHAEGSGRLRVGLIGCGGRGTGAAVQSLVGSPNMELWAMGDLFKDRLDGCYSYLSKNGDLRKDHPDLDQKFKVTPERCFSGWDAYKKVIKSGVDLVILATPPGFRPVHLKAAVEAGKHVFMEKPVAVDATGIRMVMESSDLAAQKGLGIVAGTQRRHQNGYLATIKRIHDGAIGQVVAAQCYWNQGALWLHQREPAWTDMEYQVRNWLYYTWLSGDHICEQHVHNLDVINWVIGTHPLKCVGMGGRQVRTDPAYGHIFDHFAVEYEFPGGVRLMSMCRQIEGCANNVSEHVIGTKGVSNPGHDLTGETTWKYDGRGNDPYVSEHTDLVASIRAGKPLNEGRQVAESVLTAIMGRMSAYSGKEVSWDQALSSKEDLMPAKLEFGPLPTPPVAIPGKTELI